MTSKSTREENVQAVFDLKAGYTLGLADVEILKRVARMALAAMDSKPVVQPVMFIDGDISSDDADKLAKIIREFNEEDERPLAKMARIIRENPHPTNECDMPKAQPAPVVPAVSDDIGEIRVGRLPTMNQDDYPGLGDWWVQLRIGEDSDEVLARVYGATPQEANNRAEALACRAATLQAGNSPVIPEWIPVSEQMPEDRTQVILWDAEIGEVTSGHYSHKTHTFYHCGDAIENEITHWMPPPCAPQEVNRE